MIDNNENDLPQNLPVEFKKKEISQEKQQANWQAIENGIRQQNIPTPVRWLKPLLVAASILLLLSAGVWYLSTADSRTINFYKTQFSQIKHITLPDGSKVTLNANSELTLSADWSKTGDRQVWLNGEAYFEVEKKPATHQKFVVHTKDIDVEVLGTKFNVNTRHAKAIVSLEEGKIKLSLHGKTNAILQKYAGRKVIEMKPGEVVKLDTVTGIQLAAETNIDFRSGWVRNEFHFDNTSLKDIGIMIKDVYGYSLDVTDGKLLKRSMTGDVRAANLQELLNVLEIAFKFKMVIENKSIKITQP